jgi:hypothetical protein
LRRKCLLLTQSGHHQCSLFRREERTVTTMAGPPNRTDSLSVDELLGMAYDAYARARLSRGASTKQKLTRVADGYLKQAKELRRERISSDRFFNT